MGRREGIRERQPGPISNHADTRCQGGKEDQVKPHEQHRDHSRHSLSFHIVTVSSTRFRMKSEGSEYKDESGDIATHIVQDAGHKIDSRSLLPDNKSKIRGAVRDFLDSDASAIVFIGGTGVSPTDLTVET